jgi:beta-fructofuranosidase
LWECPQIIEVDGRHVMVSSIWDDDVLHYAGYAVGTYAGGTFTAEAWGRLTYGASYYAPSFFRDVDGRPCLTFWMRGIADAAAGWASAHSVPHVLRLEGDVLIAEPHPGLERYRTRRAVDGTVPGLAADVRWRPAATGELRVVSGGSVAASLAVRAGQLTVQVGDAAWTMPAGPDIRLVLDGPVLEISSASGLLGVAYAPVGDRVAIDATEEVFDAFALER